MDDEIDVFSAPCAPDVSMPAAGNSHMVLRVSKVTIEPREMSLSEIKSVTENTSKAIDTAKALLTVGKSALYFLKDESKQEVWSRRFDVISGVADMIKGVLRFVPGPPNPVVENMKKLTSHIDLLEKEISANFDEMKILISEVNFFVKVMSRTIVLTRYMNNCLKHPGPDAVHNFKRAYLKHPPIHLAYNLRSYLEQNSTNPLKLAVDAEKLKTTTTFNKWQSIIDRILGQFFFIEAFGSGLLGKKDQFNWDRLYDTTEFIFSALSKWREEYKKDKLSNQLYWNDFKEFLEPWLEKNRKLSNAEKADGINSRLATYFTTDAFYVTVFDDHENDKNKFWIQIKIADQVITSFDHGNCNVVVYRCKKVDILPRSFLETVESFLQGNMKNKIQDHLTNYPIKSSGFTILFGGLNEEIRFCNCPGQRPGPGFQTKYYDFGGPIPRKLLVGYN